MENQWLTGRTQTGDPPGLNEKAATGWGTRSGSNVDKIGHGDRHQTCPTAASSARWVRLGELSAADLLRRVEG